MSLDGFAEPRRARRARGTTTTRLVAVRLTREERSTLARLARQRRESMSDVLRAALALLGAQ